MSSTSPSTPPPQPTYPPHLPIPVIRGLWQDPPPALPLVHRHHWVPQHLPRTQHDQGSGLGPPDPPVRPSHGTRSPHWRRRRESCGCRGWNRGRGKLRRAGTSSGCFRRRTPPDASRRSGGPCVAKKDKTLVSQRCFSTPLANHHVVTPSLHLSVCVHTLGVESARQRTWGTCLLFRPTLV